MTLSPVQYGLALQSLYEGRINIAVDPMMGMLVGPGYTPNQNTHKFKSIITNEITSSGYAAGGQRIQGAAAGYTPATKTLTITGSPLVWPEVSWQAARYLIIYMQPADTAPNLCPLLGYVDFQTNQSPDDEAFYVQWPASGIFQMKLP